MLTENADNIHDAAAELKSTMLVAPLKNKE
jgi:hypothetical protein